MATTITIQVGALTGEIVFQDDAKTAEILRRYYLYLGLGPADLEPGQVMLDAVVQGVAAEIAHFAIQHYISERRAVLEAQLAQEAAAAVDFIQSI